MQVLNQYQANELLNRFPSFELSYETVSHKKVSEHYDVTLAIPYGKKAFLWATFYNDHDALFLMELNKEKKVGRISILAQENIPCRLAYNTLLYGCLCEYESMDNPIFVVEDMMYSSGIPLYKQPYREKLSFLQMFFENYSSFLGQHCPLAIALPMMWSYQEQLPLTWQDNVPYQVHHLQHRSFDKIVPYVNIPMTKNILAPKNEPTFSGPIFIPPPLPRFDFSKPQYRQGTCFEVKADLQNDIYHLYSFGAKSKRVYCGLAYLPSYNSSVFMNGLFRNIKENRNLDALEESDDEDDFQDSRPEKYVDLEKTVVMECIFNRKFRKWMPVKAVYQKEKGRVVHIGKL
jgi:hypothetical protein